jgi:hypothetical protein
MLIDPRQVATMLLLLLFIRKTVAGATENAETDTDYPILQPMIEMKLLNESDRQLLSRVRQVNAATRFAPETGVIGFTRNRTSDSGSYSPPKPTKTPPVFDATLTTRVHVLPSTTPHTRPSIPWHELEVEDTYNSLGGYSKTTESMSKERVQSVAASWPRYIRI